MLVQSTVPTYPFHEIVRVLENPSRHYGRVQWVFSLPVHSLVSIQAHCEPILLMKTNTEGFRMNPLDVSESIDTWM